jgi:signal transduction histidine kinase
VPEIVQQNGVHRLRELRLALPNKGTATGYWDPDRLRQVIANLFSNALKYSPAGSPIDVEVRSAEETVDVLIRDYGMGLELEDFPKIFQRYYRTASAINSDTEGSGIGLYLCAQIIEAHGGRIWAESEGPELGTTVRFSLPRSDEDRENQP